MARNKNFVIDDSPELKRYVLLVDEELLFVVRQFLTLKTLIQAFSLGSVRSFLALIRVTKCIGQALSVYGYPEENIHKI